MEEKGSTSQEVYHLLAFQSSHAGTKPLAGLPESSAHQIRSAVTPDHRDYAQVMGTAPLQFSGNATQQDAAATPSSNPPAANPGAPGRPSWAQ